MNVFKRVLAGLTLSASFLVATCARAMPIPQFDKMASNQRADFDVYLLKSAVDYFDQQGQHDVAEKILDAFSTPDGKHASQAMLDFEANLNDARQFNAQHANDPGFKPLEIEHAFAMTMKQYGFIMPVSQLLLASQNYTPPSAAVGGSPHSYNK